jgi:hypothetical protein
MKSIHTRSIHGREIVIGIALKLPQTPAALAKLAESLRRQHMKMSPDRSGRNIREDCGASRGTRGKTAAALCRRECRSTFLPRRLRDCGKPRLGIIEPAS